MEDPTQLLEAVRAGDQKALGMMFAVMYADLCSIARRKLRKIIKGNSLDTTSLVHECYLRLVRTGRLDLHDESHFLGYAARVMNSVVVDSAREALAQRRCAGEPLVSGPIDIPDHTAMRTEELLHINEALQRLACSEERLVQIVRMKYFSGFTIEEIARNLGVAERTIRRDCQRARALLSSVLR